MLRRLLQMQMFSCLVPHSPLTLSSPPWSILHWSLRAMLLIFEILTLPGVIEEPASLLNLTKSSLITSRLALHTKNGTSTSPTTFLRLIVAICTVAPFCLALVAQFRVVICKRYGG